jgi:hypothetical protein
MRSSHARALKRSLIVLAVLIAGLPVLTACYSDYGMSTSDYDVSMAFYNKEVDFGAFKTFSLPDSVQLTPYDPNDAEDAKDKADLNKNYGKTILDAIRSNMKNRGYTELTDTTGGQSPDLAILPMVTTSTWTGYTGGYYPWYGYGWYYPYYGYGYYYPYYGYSYSYTTGSVIMQMLDVKAADPDTKTIPAPWFGAMNGLTSETTGETVSMVQKRITSGINRTFDLSPYLRAR